MSNGATASYPRLAVVCNGLDHALDRLGFEALTSQRPRRALSSTQGGHQSRCAEVLGLQRMYRLLCDVRGDSPPHEIGPDRLISETSLRQPVGTVEGYATVIEIPRGAHPLEYLGSGLRRNACARKPLGQLSLRQVPPRERLRRDFERPLIASTRQPNST